MAEYSQAPWSNAFAVRTGAGQAAANEIEDIKYGEMLRQRNEQIAQAKAQLFANDIDFQNGSNPYDSNIIMNENTELVRRLGEFTTKYQDWNTNPQRAMEFKQLKQSQKSTPAVLRSVAYKDAVNRLNTDLAEVAKNPGRYNTRAYENILKQVDNYNKYGNQDGAEAAKIDGPQPFVYKQPAPFIDENEAFRKVGGALQPKAIENINNGRIGAFKAYVSDEDVMREAALLYNQYPEQFDQIYGEKGVNPIQAIAAGIKPYTKMDYDNGKEDDFWKQKALIDYKRKLDKADAMGDNAYSISVLQPQKAAVPAESLAATFGSQVPHFIKDAQGNMIPNKGDDFKYDGIIYDKGLGQKGYQKTGVKEMSGYIEKPFEWGQEMGFLTKPFWGDPEVKPEFKDRVRIVTGPVQKDGTAPKYLQVDAIAEVYANDPTPMARFNKQIATSKQREGIGFPESQLQQQVYQDDVGNLFIMDSNGNPVPYQK